MIEDLRLADFRTVLAVRSTGSVTGAARALKVSPSQVSKALARMEAAINVPLFARSSRGLVLTDAALHVMPALEAVAIAAERLTPQSPPSEQDTSLTMAATSYICNFFLPVLDKSGIRFRCLELSPPALRAQASDNIFDIALTVGPAAFPPSWLCEQAGLIHKALFASPAVAKRLGPAPVSVDAVRKVPFVVPLSYADGSFAIADDSCPLPRVERIIGHEVNTVMLALEVACDCDQVVFAPRIAADRHVRAGRLVEISVEDWQVVEGLYLSANEERLLASDHRKLLHLIRLALQRLEVRGEPVARPPHESETRLKA